MIAGGTLARLALAATIGLGVDESYAIAVARPVSLSYYDHPPLAFWIAAASSGAFGGGHDVLLRLPFILLFAATTYLLYALTRRLFDARAAIITAVLAQLIPVFGIADGSWILPDGPLLLGSCLTALCLAHAALDEPSPRTRWWWLGAGVGTGIAALSKYHAIFLVAGALVLLATSPHQRRWLARPEPYVAVAIVLAMAMPVFIWNANHHWVSFRFQGGRAGAHVGSRSLTALLQNLAGQAGYLLPWVWVPLVWVFVRALRRGPNDAPAWLLACLGGGPVLVFALVSLGGRPGLPHWPAPGFFLLLPLLGDALATIARQGRARAVRWYLASTGVIVVALVTFAASQIRTGWFSRRFPALFSRGDPTLEALDWTEARGALAITRNHPLIVAANWIDAAKLGAALTPATVLCFNDDPRHFHYVADQRMLIGFDALVVLRSSPSGHIEEDRRRIAGHFRSLDSLPADTIDIHRGGAVAVRLLVFRATALLRPYAAASSDNGRARRLARQVHVDRAEGEM